MVNSDYSRLLTLKTLADEYRSQIRLTEEAINVIYDYSDRQKLYLRKERYEAILVRIERDIEEMENKLILEAR